MKWGPEVLLFVGVGVAVGILLALAVFIAFFWNMGPLIR